MSRRISIRFVGLLMTPAVLAAFVFGMIVANLLSCGSRPAMGQAGSEAFTGPVNTGLGESPFVSVAEVVIPTVVNISAEKTVTVSQQPNISGPFDEFFRRFFPEMPETPLEQHQNALGSGVIIDPQGYIVTNNHVVAGFDKIAVKLSDGTEFSSRHVKIVGRDPMTDLAVIKVESDEPLPAISFGNAEDIRVGDWAIAVGNAFGLQSTVTVGVISAKGRSGIPLPEGPSYQDFIQTDASINPGNSGGALVNVRGDLLGINSAIRSPVGANVGVGFAVPVDMVKTVTDQLVEHGKVVRGFLGIRPQAITEAIRKAKGLKSTEGVLVGEVIADQPAEKAGIEAGDVILQVNGETMEGVEQFRREIAGFAPGAKVELTLVRDGKTLSRKVTLTDFPESEQASVPQEERPEGRFGLKVRALSAEEKSSAGVEGGVLVESVEAGSPSDDAGFRQGDIILEVEGKSIGTLADFSQAVSKLSKAEAVLFRIQRGSVKMFIAVEPEE